MVEEVGQGAPKLAGAAVLSADKTSAIMEAVLDELAEQGYRGMSMEAVARRAAVGKSALYRRWASKEEMTIDVIAAISLARPRAFNDHGSFPADLRAGLREVATWLGEDRMARIFPDLLAQAMRTPAIAEALTSHIDGPRRNLARAIFDRAVERGEIDEPNLELVMDVVGGWVFWRLVARRRKVAHRDIEALTELLLDATGYRPTA